MSTLAQAILAELDAATLDELADRLAPRLVERLALRNDTARWLDTKAAAEHLCCSPGRIHDLVQLGKLKPSRDGRRLMFKQSDLDAYIEAQR